jgi:hypothetical protein
MKHQAHTTMVIKVELPPALIEFMEVANAIKKLNKAKKKKRKKKKKR